MARFELQEFPSDEALARHVASLWVAEMVTAGRRGGPYLVALSGGRIAAKLFQATVDVARRQHDVLGHVHFFWADERCVPPDHPECNFATANRLLLQPLDIPPGQVHRVRGEEPEAAAVAKAVAELRGIAPANDIGLPILDLVLLGMGEDGHVASLFPSQLEEEATESASIYRAVVATKPPPRRITLSYGVLSAARAAWVLVSGAGKETALRESLQPGARTPLGKVLGQRSRTLIYSHITVG